MYAVKAAMIETSKRLKFSPEQDALRGLVLIHSTYAEVTERLHHFSKLAHAFPELLKKYYDKLTNHDDEMVSDFTNPSRERGCTQHYFVKLSRGELHKRSERSFL